MQSTYTVLSCPSAFPPSCSFLALASPTSRSSSFKCATASLSATISSNSALAFASSFAFSCRQTPSKLAGTWRAGVGKQPAKFAYELARSVRARACSKTWLRREARGPGDWGIGAGGGGDGDAAGGWWEFDSTMVGISAFRRESKSGK